MIEAPSHTTLQEICIGIIGFTPTEDLLIKGTCKLLNMQNKKLSKANYNIGVIDINSAQDIHIYMIDASQRSAVQSRQWVKKRHPKAAIIFVGSDEPPTDHPDEYTLGRKEFGWPLIKLIETIADRIDVDTPGTAAKTCLIVDDSQLVRTQMEILLQEFQVATEFAEDAETALRMVRSRQYDIIFLDVMLPEMDGYQACKLIKSDPATKKTPVVMLTSKRSPFNRMHGALVGCDRYLTKPVDATKVHTVLQRYAVLQKAL